jgi:hypothetical protein
MKELILGIVYFLLSLLALGFIFIGIPLILFRCFEEIRSYRLSGLARKFSLDFVKEKPEQITEKNKWWSWWSSKNRWEEKNFIRGNIKNHSVEIYDRCTEEFNLFFDNYTKKETVLRIDGVFNKLNLTSVRSLDKILLDITEKDIIFSKKP